MIQITPWLKKPSKIFYGWWMVGITVLVLAVIVGPTFNGIGAFFVALEKEFGWSRTIMAGAFSLTRVEGAFMGPLEGFLIDRLGSRRMVLIGFAVLGAGLLFFSRIQGIVGLYIAFIIIFTGGGLGGFLPLMAALNHWFVRRRAMAMALGMTGQNVGGLLVPILAWAIISFGWRNTALFLGLGIWALAIPVAFMVRNRPEEYGQRPDGDAISDLSTPGADAKLVTMGADDTSLTVKEALRTRAFWLITSAHGLSVIAFITIVVHVIPALTDMGMSLQEAGLVVATYTMWGIAAQLLAGFLGDRLPKRPVIAIFIAIQAGAVLVAAFMNTAPMAFLFATLLGIGFGGRTPLLMAIRGDYFGRKSFATITGMSMLPMNIGMMVGPILAGYLYDTLGSYMVPFLVLAALNLAGAPCIVLARKPTLSASRQREITPRPSS